MKFISLAAIIMSIAAMVAADIKIFGDACPKADSFLCGTFGAHNNGLPVAYTCGPKSTVIFYDDCACADCCQIQDGNAVCVDK
ncbi:hypothetical protein K503DRAFT_86708 [Rhizopogon vinicolor AM-OR11-026]|uniref:Uncharacterized protein n=1 Tax=Rhizopogon vinicolor AM-OR11-026 TaxID=1314800 RepID=A0A1B7N3L0_9AGAM|nr:hypothetical protein K503DRAFT_86708 [Rhizopogon vinicolor AM-OR11-026]